MTALVERPRGRTPRTAAVRDQAVVASGQIAAGLGNMVFSLVMARILAPGTFAQFASFLALYLLLSMPGSAVSAVAALEPAKAARFRPALLVGGAGVGVALAVASPWVGPALRLPVAMVVVLGLSAPALGTLALDRGRLYGWNRHARLVASLVVEPAVRLLLGLALATAGGAVGGALGVTVAGYAALEIARRHPRGRLAPPTTIGRRRSNPPPPRHPRRGPGPPPGRCWPSWRWWWSRTRTSSSPTGC
jgi:O-antigen/teichoic acid export membrane protein